MRIFFLHITYTKKWLEYLEELLVEDAQNELANPQRRAASTLAAQNAAFAARKLPPADANKLRN